MAATVRQLHPALAPARLPSGVSQLPPARKAVSRYESAARAAKVTALVGIIDRVAVDRGIDPLRQPLDVVVVISLLDERGWAEVEGAAKLKHPASAETRAELVAVYEARERQRHEDPFARTAPTGPQSIAPATTTRFFVLREAADAFATKYVVGREDGYDTEAEAIAVRDERRAYGQTSGNGFRETVWVQPRAVRS